MQFYVIAESLNMLSVGESIFWAIALLIASAGFWYLRRQDREVPRYVLWVLGILFLGGHLFFDGFEGYLDMAVPRNTVTFDFASRMATELMETVGFLFLMLISVRVAAAQRTIRNQHMELALANHQILQASKLAAVGELATGIAHEINNPVGIIMARTDYMLTALNPAQEKEFSEDLRVVRSQAERVSETVRSLLTFARSSPLRVREVNLKDIVEEAMQLETPRFHAERIVLECQLQSELPNLQADPDRLQQVFINVMNNAIDAMPGGGKLRVSTGSKSPDSIFVEFSDTGSGIADANILKIFDPFFTTKPPGRGTGLGLAVSYGIVRDHRGSILVESVEGKGSTFTIVLPIGEIMHA